MPGAILQVGSEPERPFDVSRPRSVGSGERDDIALDGAGEGAVLVAPVPGGLLVESRQPLTVRGRLIPPGTRRLLRPGERAEADGWALWPAVDDAAPEETRALVGAALAGVPVTALTGPGVLVLEGAAAGHRHSVSNGKTIGRGADADVRLADPLVSRRHVRVEVRGGTAAARDLGSKNGIRVRMAAGGGERWVRGRSVRLRSGDQIQVGTTLLLYEDIVAQAPGPPGRRAHPSPVGWRIAIGVMSAALLAAALLLARAAA